MFQNPDGLWILYHPERKKMCMKVEHLKEKTKSFSTGYVMTISRAQENISFPKAELQGRHVIGSANEPDSSLAASHLW